LPEVLPEETTP